MKLHRFILDIDINQRTGVINDPTVIKQIGAVLRLKTGDQLIICDGKGYESLATLVDGDKRQLELHFEQPSKVVTEPVREVTLFCSVLKKENFEWVAQKAVEVGVSAIVPIMCERTVKLNINAARVQKIMVEAAEQSGRGVVPTLKEMLAFNEALTTMNGFSLKILLDGSGQAFPKDLPAQKNIALFIGPEGGFSEKERDMAKNQGLTCCTLGPRTLRAETAAVVASYLGAL